ncbi:MAG TPA: DNA repair protein RecO [Candidatus Sumerlaeota bacterium]|nr:DNA repair protein RecO [Candidatus Sumerlaeota bacterium]
MGIEKVQALVLDVREYRETSFLVSLLTREYGHVRGVAKGARRRGSHLAAALQPFARVSAQVAIHPSGGLANITGADVLQRPTYAAPGAGSDDPAGVLARMAYAGVFAEVLTHSHENDPHSAELFDLAWTFFYGLETAPHPGSCAVAGLFALLAALGFAVQIEDSLRAFAPGTLPKSLYQIHPEDGTVLPGAPGSVHTAGLTEGGVFVLTVEAAEALAQLARNDYAREDLADFTVGQRAGRQLLRLATHLLETHLETRLRSVRYLEEMVLRPAV